jgi:hypothetical protein
MANRYKRKEILEALFTMMQGVVDEVYTTNRPTTKDPTQDWAVVKLPYGINAESSITNNAYAQIQLFYKDRQNGIESVNGGEVLIDDTIAAIKEQLVEGGTYGHLMTCNEEPRLMSFKSDFMGYHAVVIQFKLIISFINN